MDEWDAMGFELSDETKKQLLECCDRLAAAGAYFSEALESVTAILRDCFETFPEILDEILGQIVEMDRSRPRKRWPRPKNDRVKPLLLDRRPKLYRCRNNC